MRPRDHSSRNRRRCGIETLEGRTLMTAGLQRGGVLDIRGTQRDDVIIVRIAPNAPNAIQVTENGRVTFQGDSARISSIRIRGQGGNDRLMIDESAGPIVIPAKIDGGRGNDTMQGGSGADEIIGDSGRDVVLPSSGADSNRNVQRPDALVRFGSAAAFRDFLTRAARNRPNFGVGTWRGAPGTTPGIFMPALGADARTTTTPGSSQTNTQVAGIDEADLIENDGRNLYVLSRGELLVIDASDPDAPELRSRTAVEGSPVAVYLYEGRLTVISSLWKDSVTPPGGRIMPALGVRGTGEVVVTVYDISDVTTPQAVSRTGLDGWYSDSRMVDGKLAIVVQNDLLTGYWGGPIAPMARMAGPGVSSVSDSSMARLIRKTSVTNLVPGYDSTAYSANGAGRTSSSLITLPQDILVPLNESEPNLLSVVLIQTGGDHPGVIGTASVVGGYASSMYMDASALYLFGPKWASTGEHTSVQQFDISGDTPRLVATGSFQGHLLNQFSADASGGLLRVATTRWTSSGTVNAVQVLRTEGDTLRLIGSLDGIAPGERIMSARFIDDRVYLVTFEQVDPLFTIDLSDPGAPKILGELKIPGFSRYLQPYGAGYLLGIGRDADPRTGRTLGLKLSLFDVREDSAPRELATYLVDTPEHGWSWSDAEWDHHALGFFPELGIVAVPVQAVGPWLPRPDGKGGAETKSDLMLFRVSVDTGISLLGTVSHDSPLLRSARIGDVVYSIADLDLKAVEVLADSVEARGAVELQKPWADSGSGGGGVVAV